MTSADIILVLGNPSDDELHHYRRAAGETTVLTLAAHDAADDPRVTALIGVHGDLGEHLVRWPQLVWAQATAAGVDAILTPEVIAHPVMLTSAAGNGGIPLAEQALMSMLMLNRQALRWFDGQRAHRWERHVHTEVFGQTVGIVGLGHSGTHLATICKPLGTRVWGLTRSPRPEGVPGVDRLFRPDQLHAFLAECDHVVITTPLTPDTRGMFDAAALAAMKPGAMLTNVSRGGIIVDDALLAALGDHLGGAALDAHGVEPLPDNSPFWDHPKVIVTPHNGATSHQGHQRRVMIISDNIARFVGGEPLDNIVDKVAGY